MSDFVARGHTEWYQTAPTPAPENSDHYAQDPGKHARLHFNLCVAFLTALVAGHLGSFQRPVVLVICLLQFCVLRLLVLIWIDEDGWSCHGHGHARLLLLLSSGTGRHSQSCRLLHLPGCHHALAARRHHRWLTVGVLRLHHGWLAVGVLGLHHDLPLGDLLLTVDRFSRIGSFFHFKDKFYSNNLFI